MFQTYCAEVWIQAKTRQDRIQQKKNKQEYELSFAHASEDIAWAWKQMEDENMPASVVDPVLNEITETIARQEKYLETERGEWQRSQTQDELHYQRCALRWAKELKKRLFDRLWADAMLPYEFQSVNADYLGYDGLVVSAS